MTRQHVSSHGGEHPRALSPAVWCAAALVVVVPLVFWPPAFGPFHAVKWLALWVLVPAGLAACAVAGTLRWPRWQWFVPWIAVSAAAAVLGVAPWMSLLGSPNRNAGLLALALGVGAFVLGASVGDRGSAQRSIMRATMVAAAVVGLLAVAERLGLDLAGLGDAGEVTRARSTWGSATFAGAHLVLVAPVAVVQTRSNDPRWRAVAAASTVAILAGLVATGTRAAWLAAVVAAVLLFPAWRTATGEHSGRSQDGKAAGQDTGDGRDRTRLLVAALVVAAALVVGVFTAPQLGRSTAVGRIDLWSTTPSVIAERPLLGSGPDTQRVVLPSGADAAFERAHGSEELHDRAHSLPLDTLVTTGVLGLVALVALYGVLGRDVVRNLRRQLVPTAIAAGLAAYLVTQLFAFGDPVIDPIAWLLAGILWVGVVARDGAADAGPQDRRARVAAAAALGAVGVAGVLWAGGELVAEGRLQDAVDARDSGDITMAGERADAASSVAPSRFDLDQVAARLVTQSLTAGPEPTGGEQARVALVDGAFAHLDAAQRVAGTRDPDVLMDRAELLTAVGEATAALALYDEILGLYPHSFRAHLGLGLAASQLDLEDRAETAWLTAADLAPGDARALVNLGILAERRGDPDLALERYEAALEVDPDDGAARAGVERVTPPGG